MRFDPSPFYEDWSNMNYAYAYGKIIKENLMIFIKKDIKPDYKDCMY